MELHTNNHVKLAMMVTENATARRQSQILAKSILQDKKHRPQANATIRRIRNNDHDTGPSFGRLDSPGLHTRPIHIQAY